MLVCELLRGIVVEGDEPGKVPTPSVVVQPVTPPENPHGPSPPAAVVTPAPGGAVDGMDNQAMPAQPGLPMAQGRTA